MRSEFFDREIQNAYSSAKLLEMYPYHPHGGASRSLISKYLFNRTMADRTNSNNFPAIIHHVAECLSSHEQTEAEGRTEDVKRALTFSLCEAAANDAQWHGWSSWRLIGFLRPNTNVEQVTDPDSFSRHKLAAAAYLGKKSLVQALLEDEIKNTNGMTYFGAPLQCAAKGGNTEVVRLLLGRTSAESNAELPLGELLSVAALAGHTDVVRFLLEPQHACYQKKKACELAMLQAARGGYSDVIELIRRSSNDKPALVIDNRILCQAALYGHADVIKMVLDNGANVNYCDRESRRTTPISSAASRGHKHVVQLLLTLGANQHLPERGATLSAAAARGFQSIVQLLLDHGNYNFNDQAINQHRSSSPLKVTAERGQAHMVRFILDGGMDLTRYEEVGETALRCAAANGHDTVLRMLLEAGVDVNGRDETRSPMLAALCHGRDQIVRTLAERGAKAIDVEKTIYAEKFRDGTFPTRIKVKYGGDVLADYKH